MMDEYKVYHKPQDFLLTRRKLEGQNKIAEITNYYRRNPVKFLEDILGVYLQDSQKFVIQMAWNTPYVLLNCSRGLGKTTIIDALIMAKTMLYPSYGAQIASGTGGQAQQTFQTLINIAQKNINSMASLSDIFSKELEIRNATGDGFIRNPEGQYQNLQNKSFCKTLNSNVDRRRGMPKCLIIGEEFWKAVMLIRVEGTN